MNLDNFVLRENIFAPHLLRIVQTPADPLYNACFLMGDYIAAHWNLGRLQRALAFKFPEKEILYYTGYQLRELIQKNNELFLQNFYKLHPNLLCVILERLSEEGLTDAEQEKLGCFLKKLIKQGVQVVGFTEISVGFGIGASHLSPEMWSLMQSAREFHIPYGQMVYKGDLSGALTLAQDKKRCKLLSRLCRSHAFGTLYAGILADESEKDITAYMELSLLYIGTFNPRASLFPKAKCPVCGQTAMWPYQCVASPLSGGNVIKFYCQNCKERVAANHLQDYFHMLRDWALLPKNNIWRGKSKFVYTKK